MMNIILAAVALMVFFLLLGRVEKIRKFIELQADLDLILADALGKETKQKVVKLLNEFIERNKT